VTGLRETLRAARDVLRAAPTVFYRSVFRGDYPSSVRQRLAAVANNLVLHVHPTRLYRRSLRPASTFGLGLVCFYLFVIEWITGVYLMFYYEPSVAGAYGRIQDLGHVVTFGPLMRNLHRWAAEGMVVAVVLHMCRVFYTAAYKPPREFNWVLGVFLLLLTLALSFTGYLLPWDQLSFWAITVGTSIAAYAPVFGERLRFLLLGGDTVGGDALLRFYTLHVIALPTLGVVVINYHIWRVVKDGGLARPEDDVDDERSDPAEKLVHTFPTVVYAELLVFAVLGALLIAVSLLFDAPLEEEANPFHPNNPAKAPWYFLGLQELVGYSAFWGGVFVPAALVLYLVALPYVDRGQEGIGRWLARERAGAIALWTILLVGILVTTAIGVFCRGPNWAFYWPWQPWAGPA
jgi:quinol-cytochrome oxidoreductase complex cytochrome b subunit